MAANGHQAQGDNATIVDGRRQSHPYPTRGTLSAHDTTSTTDRAPSMSAADGSRSSTGSYGRSPIVRPQKHVTFQHLLPDPRRCARLPMRIMISPQDTTESIITTVKNFYGLYGPGISFQSRDGIAIIASYDNFENDVTIYVKENSFDTARDHVNTAVSEIPQQPSAPKLGPPFEMRPPPRVERPLVQTDSLTQAKLAQSQAVDAAAGFAPTRVRRLDTRDAEAGHDEGNDSDGDGESVSSSRKMEAHVSAEISVDNIVEGGRRKRAKFESSELPLFVPPQAPMTNSISSVSPQRRGPGFDHMASPLPLTNQRTIIYNHSMASPHSYSRERGSISGSWSNSFYGQAPKPLQYQPTRAKTNGILPTPDPTIGSVISDEDVALQLMRLGDASNYGRTSMSTADDVMSRRADAASSDDESGGRKGGRHSHMHRHSVSGSHRGPQVTVKDKIASGGNPFSSDVEFSGDEQSGAEADISTQSVTAPVTGSRKTSKVHAHKPSVAQSATGSVRSGKSSSMAAPKSKGQSKNGPMSPASMESQSRRMSVASTANTTNAGDDGDEDMSAKPRCQRCRKSKKGCDRQRPCGRCKDAGLGIEHCISEDEHNGRKGRYGRLVSSTVKKEVMTETATDTAGALVHDKSIFLAPALPNGDKSKKRKR